MPNDALCYHWSEVEGGRRSNEIATCLYDWIRQLPSRFLRCFYSLIFVVAKIATKMWLQCSFMQYSFMLLYAGTSKSNHAQLSREWSLSHGM